MGPVDFTVLKMINIEHNTEFHLERKSPACPGYPYMSLLSMPRMQGPDRSALG